MRINSVLMHVVFVDLLFCMGASNLLKLISDHNWCKEETYLLFNVEKLAKAIQRLFFESTWCSTSIDQHGARGPSLTSQTRPPESDLCVQWHQFDPDEQKTPVSVQTERKSKLHSHSFVWKLPLWMQKCAESGKCNHYPPSKKPVCSCALSSSTSHHHIMPSLLISASTPPAPMCSAALSTLRLNQELER